ncbi:hypothetical protein TTHERM_000343709 (macronuclear) [Tetrahymena thermophila SB210]|uniref:Uncharacterized protein n=1 Tax=Tetrahymena thermophila (strain SB210) TaxID=312017 RepID=W7XJ19_TETTS|nr:hypothetical protein TTHERM_000343709 [Tetrahymena thermophila SB210]EWS73784.1 hypothetical protein TTHERM_000343709 [Tetrahymena thermophila SB210]|eukprot:XP_012653664.1 hypothetical protein TTHERM_000343709 [Tetrahymena thermophila SB210]
MMDSRIPELLSQKQQYESHQDRLRIDICDAFGYFVVLVVIEVNGRHFQNTLCHFSEDIKEIVKEFLYFWFNLVNTLLFQNNSNSTQKMVNSLESFINNLVDHLKFILRKSVGLIRSQKEFLYRHDLVINVFS